MLYSENFVHGRLAECSVPVSLLSLLSKYHFDPDNVFFLLWHLLKIDFSVIFAN